MGAVLQTRLILINLEPKMTSCCRFVAKNLLQGCHRLWATNTKMNQCSVNLLEIYQINVEFKAAYIFNPIIWHIFYASHRDGFIHFDKKHIETAQDAATVQVSVGL